jgi:PilZ domain
MSKPEDKRRHPRIAQRLKVKSSSREPQLELETIDLSVGGLRCTAPVFLPPMTKMALSLVLPGTPGAGDGHEQVVNGEAVVVRSDPPAPARPGDLYRVALFFSRMDEADRKRLQDFLNDRNGRNGRA